MNLSVSDPELSKRIVLDTNLVLSALIFGGQRMAQFRALWQSDRLQPLICRETAAELIRTLKYPKFKLTTSEQLELLSDYLPYCETVQLKNPGPPMPDCRDPADIPFLQLALEGKADLLVTGDRDLLVLQNRFSIPIITLRQLIEQSLNA